MKRVEYMALELSPYGDGSSDNLVVNPWVRLETT